MKNCLKPSSLVISSLIMLCAFIGLIGCELVNDPDDDDVAPIITAIELTPGTVSPSAQAEMEVTVDFEDADGDVVTLVIGGVFDVTADVSAQAGTLRQGSVSLILEDWNLISIGEQILEIALIDENGNRSATVDATANVSNTP
ncbi:MAG: hypothetical protein O3A01_08655 [bacterium]|nr:hypothetical protein [bacterium]